MRLEPMRYKEYTWPHNPETYTVEYRRCLAAHKVPFGGYCLQDLGNTYRVLRGEGVFAGESLSGISGPGGSVWPGGPGDAGASGVARASAYFVSLQLTESRCRIMCIIPLSFGRTGPPTAD